MFFKDELRFLSNMYEKSFYLSTPFHSDQKLFKSVEHYYQACKAKDKEQFEFVKNAENGFDAKRRGRIIMMRDDFNDHKLNVMFKAVYAKFSQNKDLKELLLLTNDEILIENNWWHDNYWGSCVCHQCNNIGLNKLGEILMKVRNELKEKK